MPSDDLESKLAHALAGVRADVIAAYLFGSRARGTARRDSDLDVALLLRGTPAATLEGMGLDIAADLERALGQPVDVVILNGAHVDLVHRVLRDGRLLLERDRSARIQFEVRARNDYFDMQPIL